MRETLSLNLYVDEHSHLNYSLLSKLYFFDVSKDLSLFNTNKLYSTSDILSDQASSETNEGANDNAKNLQARRIEYTFYSKYTNIFLLLDVSPSVLKYEGNTLKIQLDLLEEMIWTMFKDLHQTLSQLRTNSPFKFYPRLSIFVFGFPQTDFLNLVNGFCLDEDSMPALKEKIDLMFNHVYEKLYQEVTKSKETWKSSKHSFDAFFSKFMAHFSKNYNDHNTFSKFLLVSDGICFENSEAIFRALQMNKLHMACDIIMVGHPNDNNFSNDLGFIAAESPLNALAKLLNGRMYSYNEFKRASLGNKSAAEKSQASGFLKICLGITQVIKFVEPGEQGEGKYVEKPNTIKPFEKIRKQHYKSSALQIQNFHDFLNDKIISSWRICYISKQNGFEKEMILRIKFGPKLDLLAYLTFQVSAQTQKLCLNRVIHYIRGPRYLVSSITDIDSKNNLSKTKFNNMHEYPTQDNLLFEVIPNTISLKYDKENNRYDLNFNEHAHRVLELINKSTNWHKYFVADRLLFVFKIEFDGQAKKWTLKQKVEELMNNFTNKALSKSLYLKLLVSQDSDQMDKLTPVRKFCLIKCKWLTKQILSFKIGVYSAVKLGGDDFESKNMIMDKISQQLLTLDGTRVSNSIINVFIYSIKQTLQINYKFATTIQIWETCCCIIDLTPFFMNLNYDLTHDLKFVCIFAAPSEFLLTYMTRIKFQTVIDETSGEKQSREKEIFCQISFDKKKKKIIAVLFTDPFDAPIDFEFQGKTYKKASLDSLVKLFKEQIAQALSSNMSRIFSVHFLHRRSVEWKLNKDRRPESKIIELNQKYYKWRNIHHDYEEDELQALAAIKHYWQHILTSDYKEFALEKHKNCLSFADVFEYATKVDSIKLNIFSLADKENATEEALRLCDDGIEVLFDDYNKDMRKICDFEYSIDSPQQETRLYTKFLLNRKLLIMSIPKSIKIDKHPEVEFYILDVDAVEYPVELHQNTLGDEKIDNELLKLLFSAAREIKEKLQEDFNKSFSRNVYRVSTLGLQLTDQALNDAISNCSKDNFLDLDMSDFFEMFSSDLKASTDAPTSPTAASSASSSFSEKKWTDFDYFFESKGISTDGEKLKLEVYENLIDNLIKAFFKKINPNTYIEQSQPIEHVLQTSNEIPSYITEFIPLARKITLEPKFLTIKIRVQIEGQDMQFLTYDGFINTCKMVFNLIQNQRAFKVLMRLNLIWEPFETKETDSIRSPGAFYNVSPAPYELVDANIPRPPRLESPSSPHFVPGVLKDLCSALEKVMNVLAIDMQRFVRPITSEVLSQVDKRLGPVARKQNFDVSIDCQSDSSESILISELLKMKNLPLKKRDKIFFLYKKRSDSESFKESLSAIPSDENIDIPYWFLVKIEREAQKLVTVLQFPPYKGLNYRHLRAEYEETINQTVNKVQTLIIMNELRSTLYCPPHLKLGDELHGGIKRITNDGSMMGKTHRGIGMGSFIRKNMRDPKKKGTVALNKKAEEGVKETKDNSTKNFEIPMIHRELFPVYERIRKGAISFANYSFFRNFNISNIENAFLAFNDKEIYILVLNEVDNKFYQPLGEDVKKTIPVTKPNVDGLSNLVTREDMTDRSDLLNSKTILVLRVYSMEKSKPQVINNFITQIYELLTLDSIRCFATAFLNSVQIRFTAADIDYLSYADRKLTIRFEVPSVVADQEAFLHYLKQKMKRYLFTYMVHHPSNARSSYHKISNASANDDESPDGGIKSPKFINHESLGTLEILESYFEPSEYTFFYNCLRPVNDIQLHEYFGKCLFLMSLNLRKFSKEENCYKDIKKFELNVTTPKDKDEPRISVPLQNPTALQEEIENHFKSSDLSFIEDTWILDSANVYKPPSEPVDAEQIVLDCDITLKGKINEEKFQILLGELINHTIYDYFIENLFLNYHLPQLNSPQTPQVSKTSAIDKKLAPIYSVAYFLDQIASSTRVQSTSIHHFTLPHIAMHNQLFEVFRHLAHMVENAIIEKIGNNSLKVPIVYFIEQSIGGTDEYKLCGSSTDIMKLLDQYNQLFKYPMSFIKKQLPKISGVFCGVDPENPDSDEMIWTEKIKIFDSQGRPNSTLLPRNIFAQFYITEDEIGFMSYNFHEELHFNIQTYFQGLVDWTSRRHQLLQALMNDRVGFCLASAQTSPNERLSRRNTFRRGELGFISELNRPSLVKTQQSADIRKWSDRVYQQKNLGINASGSLVLETHMNFAKTLKFYSDNLYCEPNQQRFLTSFDSLYEKIHFMNLRCACVKAIKEYGMQEENLESKRDMDSFVLDDEDSVVTDLISHHMLKFMEVAKNFFKKSKDIIKLKFLMKKAGLPDNYKKPLLNSFIVRSNIISNQKIPLIVIPNKTSGDDDSRDYDRNIADILQKQNQEEEQRNNAISFINGFSEKLMNEILNNKCFRNYENFFVESTDPNLLSNLAVKGDFSVCPIDDYDMRKISRGSPMFGGLSMTQIKEKEEGENLFDLRRSSIKDDGVKEDFERFFNPKAREDIETVQRSHQLVTSTIYLRRVEKTVLFLFKFQISYPFLSLSIMWNTLTENKSKVEALVNKEANKIFSHLNLKTIVYECHISLFKELLTGSSPESLRYLDLPQIFMHFVAYYDKTPDGSQSVFHGAHVSVKPGYLYTKFNTANIWNFMAMNCEKYGLESIVDSDSSIHMYVFMDYSTIPEYEAMDLELRPKILFIMHSDESKKSLQEPEKKLNLDQESNLNTEFLHISYFILYDKETSGLKLEGVKTQAEKIILEMLRKLRKHFIANLFLNKIMRNQDTIMSSDELQNLLVHSNATPLKKHDKKLMDAISELSIFDQAFVKYFESLYSGHIRFFRENHGLMDNDDLKKKKEAPISSILLSSKALSLTVLIQMNKSSCIEDIYLLKTNDDPTILNKEETEFFNLFKKSLMMFIWKCNLVPDHRK